MTKNQMYVHYEEFGKGIDLKVTINDNIVVQYFITVLGMTCFKARKTMSEAKSDAGWPVVFDGDEQFYRFIKEMMIPEARDKVVPKEAYCVSWMQNGIYQEAMTTDAKFANSVFNSKERDDLPVALFFRQKAGKWRANPLRKAKSQWVEILFVKARDKEQAEMQECADGKGISSCNKCYRHCIPDSKKGCPIYARRIKK